MFPASILRAFGCARIAAPVVALGFLPAPLLPHCQHPTEVTLSISTDVPCAQVKGVTITVGAPSAVETMAPETVSQTCTGPGVLGTIVVVPGGARNAVVDIKIVEGVNRDPASCTAPGYGTGCIVSRRSLEFIPHTPLTLDISMSSSCNGVACPADQTCSNGACTSSTVINPDECAAPGGCAGSSLKPATGPPLPPSPLVCGDASGLQPGAIWPMMGFCPTHIGRGPVTGAQTNSVKWKAYFGARVASGIAIAADGTIYAGTGDGRIHAVDASGNIKWSLAAGSAGFRNAVPAIGSDGTFYLASQDTNLYAVSPGGKTVWKYALGGKAYTSAAVGADGTIYVGSGPGNTKAFALGADGAVKWQYTTGGDVYSSPAIALDGSLVVGSNDLFLYGLSATGKKEWSFDVKEDAITAAVGSDGTVYFNGKESICAVSPKGALVWVTPTTSDATVPAIGWDGTIYAGDTNGGFFAYDGARGTTKWQLTIEGLDELNQPTIGADGTIYIGSTSGTFYAIAPDARIKWQLATGGGIHGPAAIGADGTVYFGSDDGRIYAVGP